MAKKSNSAHQHFIICSCSLVTQPFDPRCPHSPPYTPNSLLFSLSLSASRAFIYPVHSRLLLSPPPPPHLPLPALLLSPSFQLLSSSLPRAPLKFSCCHPPRRASSPPTVRAARVSVAVKPAPHHRLIDRSRIVAAARSREPSTPPTSSPPPPPRPTGLASPVLRGRVSHPLAR